MVQIIFFAVFYCTGLWLQYLDTGTNISTIISMLCVIIFASLYLIFADLDFRFYKILIHLFILLCIPVSTFRPYMDIPLLIHKDNFHYTEFCLSSIPFILYCRNHTITENILLFLLLFFAIAVNILYRSLNTAREQLLSLRDASREQQMIVEEKNKALRERQDINIHLATLQERNRIAREIHDNVGHMLTRSILQTGAIKTINHDQVLSPLLDALHDTLNVAMNNIRESVHDLHDESIDLDTSIKEILNTAADFETVLQIDPDINVPKKIKYSFLAIIKEAVNNTIKHSNGSKISVILREHPGFYQLLIEDDGNNTNQINLENGIGLENIQDRVKEIGGRVHYNYENGFKIFITVLKK